MNISALQVRRLEQNTELNAKTEKFIIAKISGNALKQGNRTHSVLHQRSLQLQKYNAARMSRRQSSQAEKVCGWDGGHPGLTVLNLLNYTRIENAHQVRKKTFVFLLCGCYMYNYWGDRTDSGFCESLWSIRLDCHLRTKFEMMRIWQAQVCGCISAYRGLPHQHMKRETSGASKSQLNQASRNRTVLKVSSENHKNVRNYLSILFLWFSFDRTIWHISVPLKKVTSLTSVARGA